MITAALIVSLSLLFLSPLRETTILASRVEPAGNLQNWRGEKKKKEVKQPRRAAEESALRFNARDLVFTPQSSRARDRVPALGQDSNQRESGLCLGEDDPVLPRSLDRKQKSAPRPHRFR